MRRSFDRPLVRTIGDGNCLYYSLMAGLDILQCPDRPPNAMALKKQLINYIDSTGRYDHRLVFVMQTLDWDQWVATHRRPNAWGDEVVIVAFSRLYPEIQLRVQTRQKNGTTNTQTFNELASRVIVIGTDQRHFNLITCLCPRDSDLSRVEGYSCKSKIRWT